MNNIICLVLDRMNVKQATMKQKDRLIRYSHVGQTIFSGFCARLSNYNHVNYLHHQSVCQTVPFCLLKVLFHVPLVSLQYFYQLNIYLVWDSGISSLAGRVWSYPLEEGLSSHWLATQAVMGQNSITVLHCILWVHLEEHQFISKKRSIFPQCYTHYTYFILST